MNFQLKISIFYIVFVFIGAFAQAQEKEVVNYWTLRKRLVGECTEDFFGDCNNPFVHTGANLPGYGIPLGEMNYKLNYGDVNGDCGFDQSGTGALKWGDGTSYMGYYWAVLATEKKLLEKYGYETHKTEVELFWALKAFERLDETAESYWGCSNSYNGAFMRDDVPTSIINSNYIGYNCIASDYINNANLGTQGNNIMSKDQIVNVFMGLMFIKKMFWATDGVIVNGEYMNFHMKAVEIADKIANYIHLNYTSPTVSWNNYQIKNPCNGILASLGYDALFYSWPLCKAYNYITGGNITCNKILPGLNPFAFPLPIFSKQFFTTGNSVYDTYGEMNAHMQALLAAMSNNFSIFPHFPVMYISINSWTVFNDAMLHQNSQGTILEIMPLIRAVLHGKEDKVRDLFDIEGTTLKNYIYGMLQEMDCEGPRFYGPGDPENIGGTQWNSNERWEHCNNRIDGSPHGVFWGKYPGIDYMLLHNLYFLIWDTETEIEFTNNTNVVSYYGPMRNNATNFPIYHSGTNSYYGSTQDPRKMKAVDTLSYYGVVGQVNSVYGNLTLQAGKNVEMTEGFDVLPGAVFDAYTKPFKCDDGSFQNRIADPNQQSSTTYDPEFLVKNAGNMTKEKYFDYYGQFYNEGEVDTLWSLYQYQQTLNYDSIQKVLADIYTQVKASEENQKTKILVKFDVSPNPFSSVLNLSYKLETVADVELSLYDILGKKYDLPELSTQSGEQSAGTHELSVNTASLPSGTYFLRIRVGDAVLHRKLVKM